MAGNPSNPRSSTQSSQQQQSSSLQQKGRSGLGRDLYSPGFGGGLFSSSPFALLREMTDLMDRTWGGTGSRSSHTGSHGGTMWSPALEVCQQENEMKIWADLPGLDPKDVKLEIDNDQIVIQGERKQEHNEEREGWHRSERVYGSFYRAIPLPEGARADDIKAEFRNGVLEVNVPLEQPKSTKRQIQIQSGGSSSGSTGSSTGSSTTSPAGSSTHK
jgi:HSP20 family protein